MSMSDYTALPQTVPMSLGRIAGMLGNQEPVSHQKVALGQLYIMAVGMVEKSVLVNSEGPAEGFVGIKILNADTMHQSLDYRGYPSPRSGISPYSPLPAILMIS